ncbi:MAG: hypothetical protein ABMA64_04530 [Myxococcota bacterium]
MIPVRTLRQYLALALDPPEHEQVERALAADPELLAQLALLIAETPPLPDRPAWAMPPPGIAAGLRGAAAPVAVMDADGPAGWWQVELEIPADHAEDWVVLLERAEDVWEVVFPTGPSEVTRASELPRRGDRARVDLHTVARRLAVVLVPPDLVRWGDADPWAEVRDRLPALPVWVLG